MLPLCEGQVRKGDGLIVSKCVGATTVENGIDGLGGVHTTKNRRALRHLVFCLLQIQTEMSPLTSKEEVSDSCQ